MWKPSTVIWSRTGGSESGPLLVLLPGLGATAEVFAGVERVLADSWPGGWVAVDLPGHGRSAWDPPYTFARHAEAVRSLLPLDRDLIVLGHSMGGVVGLELADGSTPAPATPSKPQTELKGGGVGDSGPLFKPTGG